MLEHQISLDPQIEQLNNCRVQVTFINNELGQETTRSVDIACNSTLSTIKIRPEQLPSQNAITIDTRTQEMDNWTNLHTIGVVSLFAAVMVARLLHRRR